MNLEAFTPGSALITTGSSRNGSSATALANLAPNSPKARCSARERTRPNAALSQNTLAPPVPSTIS